MKNFRIGPLAAASGCQVETIRYYEREGLLPAPERSSGNYRLYTVEHLERLTFIRHCRTMDMALADVRRLLHFKDAPEENCSEVNHLLDMHIEKIARRVDELQVLQQQMTTLRSRCSQELAAKHCGILQGLALADKRQ